MAKQKDYYELLGVQRDASADQIRSAYRKLARQFHPDVNKAPDAPKRFAEIQEAYDVLSDDEKRKAYNQFGHAGVGVGSGPGAGWAGGVGGPRGRKVWTTGPGAGAEDLGDIFEEIFGGRAGRARSGASPFDVDFEHRTAPQPHRGQDVEHPLTISFMTAALGGSEQLRFTVDGSTSTISVKIPAGIDTGGRLRIKGRGQPSLRGGAAGDLILNVEVGRHPYFRREGLDVFIDVPITIAEAVLGTTVSVPLLKSEGGPASRIELKVPPGVTSGRKLRVRGKGISDASGTSGDYYAMVQIVAPPENQLSEDGRRIIAQLAPELPNPRNVAPFVE